MHLTRPPQFSKPNEFPEAPAHCGQELAAVDPELWDELALQRSGQQGRPSTPAIPLVSWYDFGCGGVHAMAVISLKLTEALDAQLTEQAQRRRLSKSELVRRALTAFLQSSEHGAEGAAPQSAADLLADLMGCCEGGPADLSSNPAYLSDFGTR